MCHIWLDHLIRPPRPAVMTHSQNASASNISNAPIAKSPKSRNHAGAVSSASVIIHLVWCNQDVLAGPSLTRSFQFGEKIDHIAATKSKLNSPTMTSGLGAHA